MAGGAGAGSLTGGAQRPAAVADPRRLRGRRGLGRVVGGGAVVERVGGVRDRAGRAGLRPGGSFLRAADRPWPSAGYSFLLIIIVAAVAVVATRVTAVAGA